MSQLNLPIITDSEIRKFLENAPLYSWHKFVMPKPERTSLYINEIDGHCGNCDKERPFSDMRTSGGGAGHYNPIVPPLSSGTSYFEFSCVSCKRETRIYLVEQVVEGEIVQIQKFGELPRGKVPRDRRLQRFLKDDREQYEKAVMCLSQDYGIAAFVYFRRIIEANIGRLLDLVQEDAAASGENEATLQALESLRKESPMSERIRLANLALPTYLRPNGMNPLGHLYQVLSEGVHNMSEEECLLKARNTSECLAFLVSELASRRESRDEFKSMISKLSG